MEDADGDDNFQNKLITSPCKGILHAYIYIENNRSQKKRNRKLYLHF